MTSQLRHFFQASQAVHVPDDILWGFVVPKRYSDLLKQAGVSNLILFTLDLARPDIKKIASLDIWGPKTTMPAWQSLFTILTTAGVTEACGHDAINGNFPTKWNLLVATQPKKFLKFRENLQFF